MLSRCSGANLRRKTLGEDKHETKQFANAREQSRRESEISVPGIRDRSDRREGGSAHDRRVARPDGGCLLSGCASDARGDDSPPQQLPDNAKSRYGAGAAFFTSDDPLSKPSIGTARRHQIGDLEREADGFETSTKNHSPLDPGLAHLNFPHNFTIQNRFSWVECFFAIANSWRKRFFRQDVHDQQDKNRCMCVFESLFATGLLDFILYILYILSKCILE